MTKKVGLILLGSLLLLTLLWLGALRYAGQRVAELIAAANTDGNELVINDWNVRMGVFSVGIHADSIHVRREVAGRRLSGTIAELEVRGVSVRSLLFSDRPRVHSLSLKQPRLTLVTPPADEPAQDTTAGEADRSLPFIKNFTVEDGSFVHQYGTDSVGALRLFGIEIERRDLSLSGVREGWNDARFSVDSVAYPTRERAAAWHVRELRYEPDAAVLTVGGIRLTPYETAVTFLRRQRYGEGWLAVDFSNLALQPFQPDSVFAERRSLRLDSLNIGSFSLANYVDPRLPDGPEPARKLLPVEQFRRLGFPLYIANTRIAQGRIIYAMLAADNEPAELAITNAQVTLRHLSTQPIADSLYASIDATFDRAARMEARFAFDQSGNGRALRAWGEVGPYEMVKINPLMITAADAYIESGQLESLTYQADIVNETATGSLLLRYRDLKIDLQNAWFKNLIKGAILKDRNPAENGDLRYGRIYHEHAPERSFFNFYWKAILSGLRSTVVADFVNQKELKSTERESN